MSVRPYAHTPNNDSHKAAFYARKPVGIKRTSPTPGSNTQKRKQGKQTHQPYKK